MDRLFRQSGLFNHPGRPDKWAKVHHSDGRTYGQATIDKAIADCRETYSGRRPVQRREKFPLPDDRPSPITGEQRQLIDLALRFKTDLGNSERLIVRHGRDLRYCFDFGKWLVWDGVRWAIDRNGMALDRAKATARKILAEAATLDDTEDSRKLAAWSFRSQARERLSAMLFLAQPDVSVLPEQLDTHPWLLNVANGTIDLRTGTLRQPSRPDLMTKQSPVVYDPQATCRQFLEFVHRIFQGNADLIRFVQKAAGYSLTGLDTEECFFVLHGVGQNGKSTFVETLSALLGTDYAQQATPDLLMQKRQERHATELAVLRGARLVASIETGQGKRLNEALIKAMTGGDRIRANFMHQDTFEFRPEFKVWLSTNHKPVITGTDLGIWRRIRLVPFAVIIPDAERDGAFKARLREPAALSGILNWALEGVLLWQKEGLKPPQAVLEATQAYREEMDVLAAWIADCCVVAKLAEAKAADLFASYTAWCAAQGERPEAQRNFGLGLTERGFTRNRTTGGAHRWLGIGLLVSDPSDPSDPESDIKGVNSREYMNNVENRVTSVTSVTSPAADHSSQHPGPPPVDGNEWGNV
jgi:putative DNA primase/helicase